MSERKIEAIVDALSHVMGSVSNPDGDLHQIRNPIGLLNFSRPGVRELDSKGRRIFSSWLSGYRAACFDIAKKCSGESRAGLKAEDKLENLLGVFGIKERLGVDQVVKYLRRSLKDQSISRTTLLSWFLEDK